MPVWPSRWFTNRNAQPVEASVPASPRSAAPASRLAATAQDIATPLGGVLSLLDLMLGAPGLPREARADAAVARQAVGDLMLLLRDLDGAQDGAPPPLAEAPFRVDEVMEHVVALLQGRAVQRGGTLATAVAIGTPALWIGDAARLRQALIVLVARAVQASEGGTVQVQARASAAGMLEIGVSQIGTLARQEDGAMPGLSMARDIVARMGGTFSTISAPGSGSLITLALPLPLAFPQALSKAAEAQPAETRAAVPVVLVIDDVAVNRLLLGTMLERTGFAHEGADGAESALAMLRARSFAAVLMDLEMPDIDGLEATRLLRALPAPAGRVPVLAVTAQDTAESRAAAAEAGMDGYLVKPIGAEQLAASLRTVMSRGDADAAPPPYTNPVP